MKQKPILLVMGVLVLFCSPASAGTSDYLSGIGDVAVHLNGGDDVAYIGDTNIVEFWIKNDVKLAGMSIGFEFTIGREYEFDPVHGGTGYVKEHGDAIGAWNMGGLLVTAYIDDASPDSIIYGGVSMPPGGLPAHLTHVLCYTMAVYIPPDQDPLSGGFCIDNVVPAGGTWTFAEDGGGSYAPDFQGNPNSGEDDPDAPEVCFDIVPGPLVILTPPASYSYIANVPDWNQPPASASNNYCAPTAALNIIDYWQSGAFPGVDSLVDPADAAVYPAGSATSDLIGYFMGTNGSGCPRRMNKPPNVWNGTHFQDQRDGFYEYVAWAVAGQFGFDTVEPTFPAWKIGYFDTNIVLNMGSSSALWDSLVNEIDCGQPTKIDFRHWNIQSNNTAFVDPMTQDTVVVYGWKSQTNGSDPPDPEEDWSDDIGHAVTGIGYISNWNGNDWAIVHDNWPTTDVHIAIPWQNLIAMITADPPTETVWGDAIDSTVDLTPYFDWGAITSFYGLGPAPMGIASFWYGWDRFYFPSDSTAPFTSPPGKSWITSGVHPATNYGTDTVRISGCPKAYSIVTVPDRNTRPCTLFVEIPPQMSINNDSDSNVIQLSRHEVKSIPINDTAQIVAFLATCDGDAQLPVGPSPDQSLEARLNYGDGSADTIVIDSIHPAGRFDIADNPSYPPSWLFLFGNEVFVCDPQLYDYSYFAASHSEAWHWYALYPDTSKLLSNITFRGRQQTGGFTDIYILALSYSGRGYEDECSVLNPGFENGQLGQMPDDWTVHDSCKGSGAYCEHEAKLVSSRFFEGSRSLHMRSKVVDGGTPDSYGSLTTAWTEDWINCPNAGGVRIRLSGISNDHSTSWGWNTQIWLCFTDGVNTNYVGDIYYFGESSSEHNPDSSTTGADGTQWYWYDREIPAAIDKTHMRIGIRCIAGAWSWHGYFSELQFYADMVELVQGECDCDPGDANNSGTVDIDDVVYLIGYIFSGGPAPVPYQICSGDPNCSCGVDIDDVVYLVAYIFLGGPPPCSCDDWLVSCGSPLRISLEGQLQH
jgi:hypothetical protein